MKVVSRDTEEEQWKSDWWVGREFLQAASLVKGLRQKDFLVLTLETGLSGKFWL